MKSILLTLCTVLAAGSALAFLPVGAVAAGGNVLLIVGLLAVFLVDYGRILKPLRAPAPLLAFHSPERTRVPLRHAA
jgi:hypothetical protein